MAPDCCAITAIFACVFFYDSGTVLGILYSQYSAKEASTDMTEEIVGCARRGFVWRQ